LEVLCIEREGEYGKTDIGGLKQVPLGTFNIWVNLLKLVREVNKGVKMGDNVNQKCYTCYYIIKVYLCFNNKHEKT
jgi:hypothetical protein